MIVGFTVENFRSIKGEVKLNFEASTSIKDTANSGFPILGNMRLLNSMAFFGANSSGKSNVFKAVSTMKRMVVQSVKLNDNERLPYDPFILSNRSQCPTMFEMVFVDQSDKFTYGFEYTSEGIVAEWLHAKFPRRSAKTLLERRRENVIIDEQNFSEGVSIREGQVPLNRNRLFVSLAAQLGGMTSKRVIEWFRTHINVISGDHDEMYSNYTRRVFHHNEAKRSGIQSFLSTMDLGLSNITTRMLDVDELERTNTLPSVIIQQMRDNPPISVFSRHNVYNDRGEVIGTTEFDLDMRESAGTQKLFNLAGPIIDTLTRGAALFIDELDAQIHPLICRKIVNVFNNVTTNSRGAQLVFTSQDTNMLSKDLLRRDQFMFVSKDQTEATKLTPLLDITLESGHKPRTDSNFEKNYLEGKFGAIPNVQEGFLWDEGV